LAKDFNFPTEPKGAKNLEPSGPLLFLASKSLSAAPPKITGQKDPKLKRGVRFLKINFGFSEGEKGPFWFRGKKAYLKI